jgi:hypothetical protein
VVLCTSFFPSRSKLPPYVIIEIDGVETRPEGRFFRVQYSGRACHCRVVEEESGWGQSLHDV